MARPVSQLACPAFPLRKGPRGYFAMATEEEVIRQSVLQILGTNPGERVMRPTFGCDLEALAFEPNDEVLGHLLDQTVRDALAAWEPRIDVTAIDQAPVDNDTNQLAYVVRYTIRSSGASDSVDAALDLRR